MSKDDAYSVAVLVKEQGKQLGDAPVFTFEGETTSYAELDSKSNKLANALLHVGIQQGDRVAYLGKNTPFYFELIAAAAKIGAVVTSVNWRLAAPEVTYVLADSVSKILFVGAEFLDLAAEIEAGLPKLLKRFDVEGAGQDFPHVATWRDGFSAEAPQIDTHCDNALVQLYTSGTTGRPKGVVISHRSILALRGQAPDDRLHDWQIWEEGETGLLAMPCFHVGGTVFGLGMIYTGSHAIVVREYNAGMALDFIETYGIGKMFMVPAALQILLNDPRTKDTDFSKLRYVYYGASPIPLELMRESMRVLGCQFVQMYGMTETSGTIVALNPEDHDPNGSDRMRSVGRPLHGVEVKVVDPDGAQVPVRDVGEIVVRSVKNMTGYWNKPDATEATIDTEGWLRTGDAGYLDEGGYLYIHDRIKDMIISGGENVYPAEVENALYSHPGIAEVAVIGVPDEKWGEAVMAYIVPKSGASLNAKDVITFARTQIAGYKCPKSIAFIDALPRNASGKILRKDLRAEHWKGREREVN
ncbi:MAG: fatty acid--CoA ligase [Henriciella sp.]